MFAVYSPLVVLGRRIFAIFLLFLTWPCVLFPGLRATYGSLLHRYWTKEGDKPVWMMLQEKANGVDQENFDLG